MEGCLFPTITPVKLQPVLSYLHTSRFYGPTTLCAAYIKHRAKGKHEHVVTDRKPSIDTSKACQLDQVDSLSP